MVRRKLFPISAIFVVVVAMMACGVPLFANQMDWGSMPPGGFELNRFLSMFNKKDTQNDHHSRS